MKKITYCILLFFVIAGAFLAGSWYNQHAATKPAAVGAAKPLYYVDPMHPAYKSDKPGIAPDCGMQLEPVFADSGQAASQRQEPARPAGTVNITPEKQQLVGVRVAPVGKARGIHTLRQAREASRKTAYAKLEY